MVKLSKRMQAVANLVGDVDSVADIGCDHGYLPIYLVSEGHANRAVAMDVRKGPLAAATEHIKEAGLEGKISTRLSDGLTNLKEGEGECVIVAGMGGRLVIRILQDALPFLKENGGVKRLVLQPQSELAYVRSCLREMGLCCVKEDMVLEDGKFYPMGCYEFGEPKEMANQELFDLYGTLLLTERHPVLYDYLIKELETFEEVQKSLSRMKEGEKRQLRQGEIEQKLRHNQMARDFYNERG
ncbi:tRNA (adenine22-N1)-methyltransferase [Lachnospiraceae bacterium XBB1006]|nr:tRNA (adenine22-N1)-methyltransferase [Lachnospiraceae bacterium XBB1006]